MPLKLTRTVQQAIVAHPIDDPDKCLTIRVMDIVPNAVCLGLMGDEYSIVRAEKFNQNIGDEYSIVRAEKFNQNNNAYHEGNNDESTNK